MKLKYDVNDEKFLEKSKGLCCIPKRYVFVLLGFLGFFNLFATRVCLHVAIVVMVNSTMMKHLNSTQIVSECPHPIQREESETKNITAEVYNWDAHAQGLILGAIFYGVILSSIPGAVLCQKFGAKWFFGGPLLLSNILTLLTPVAADWGVGPLVVLRVLQGLAQGLTFPAINAMIAKWSHILERSRFVSLTYTGVQVGNIVSTMVSGWLSSTDILGGWPLTFYVFGISGCIWFIFWAVLIYETPGEHRYISSKELQYLEGSTEIAKKKLPTPWKEIFTSVPMWAAIIANVSNGVAIIILMIEIPTYLSSVLHVDVLSDGMVLALAFTAKAIASWFASYIADLLRRWNTLSITNIRKLFTAVALFGTAVSLLGVTLSGCHLQLITGLVVLCTAITGFFYAGVGTVHIDMSPTFAGPTFAIIDVFVALTGIVGPSIVGAVTSKGATVTQWNCVFYIVIAFQAISGLIFIAFGSAELQSWGNVDACDSSVKVENPKLNSSVDDSILKIQSFARLPSASGTTAENKS